MLKIQLVHPEILYLLGKAGHGSKVLIADGDYPASTTAGKNTKIVHLNLSPGVVSGTQVLDALAPIILIEDAVLMDVPQGQAEPPIWDEYRKIFRANQIELTLKKLERHDFYQSVAADDTALTIQTGELREYANLLLTIGSL